MAKANNWIATGDRTHPTLKLVDELKEQLTYDGYIKDLQQLEDAHLNGEFSFKIDEMIFQLHESQRIHDGDRSHPRLVELDNIRGTLTYDGWEVDVDEALTIHKSYRDDDSMVFDFHIEGMKRRQRMSIGDYRHPNLKFLFSLELTFPGWEEKLEEAVNRHKNGWDIDYFRYSLIERQRVFEGVRVHPRLVALDALTLTLMLTYPGWEKDVKEIEMYHLDDDGWYDYGVSDSFREKLNFLEGKQMAYETEDVLWKYHPIQKEILNMEWTYPGFEDDLDEVRAEDPTSSEYTFKNWKDRCTICQMIHDGNFEDHDALVKLNELMLSYPEWEKDFEEAIECLKRNSYDDWPDLFDNHMKGMKNKQAVYEGSKKAEEDKKKANNPSKHLGACAICLENPQTHAFVPCGHVCACKECSTRVMAKNKKCPMCNKVSKMTMELFFC